MSHCFDVRVNISSYSKKKNMIIILEMYSQYEKKSFYRIASKPVEIKIKENSYFIQL